MTGHRTLLWTETGYVRCRIDGVILDKKSSILLLLALLGKVFKDSFALLVIDFPHFPKQDRGLVIVSKRRTLVPFDCSSASGIFA